MSGHPRALSASALAFAAAAAVALGSVCVGPGAVAARQQRRSGGGGSERVGRAYTPGPADFAPATAANPTKADAEPYTRWKNHDGGAEQAVVFVRMELTDEATGRKQVRTGTGLVIRCDGFVLVPPTIATLRMSFDGGKEKGQAHTDTKALTLTFAAGYHVGEDGRPGVPPPQAVFQPRFYEEYRDFAALKANEAHVRALPMLHPKNVREAMPVRIVYALPDPKRPGVAKAVTVSAAVGKGFEPNKRRRHFEFAPAEPGGELPRVPMGAVVIDPASGLALGMVGGANFRRPRIDASGDGDAEALLADGGRTMPADPAGPYATAYSFATFENVYYTQNAVALLPDPTARDGRGSSAEDTAAVDKALDGMVYIPGGPVELYDWYRGWLRQEYRLLYGVDVACTAGFWIDRQEVTRKEYGEFLNATGHRPLPAGWTEAMLSGEGGPPDPDRPVTGVRTDDAQAYAEWRGKRLVTPVEWAKAARMASSAFLEQHQASLEDANFELDEINLREREAVAMRVAELQAQKIAVEPNARFDLPIQRQLEAERRVVVRDFLDRSGFVVQGTAAGAVEGDVSIYGVRDVTSNAPEWLLPNLGKQGQDVSQKPLHIPLHPPARIVGTDRHNPFTDVLPGRPLRPGAPPTSLMASVLWSELSKLVGRDPEYDLRFFGITGNGFRCAR